MNRSLKSIFAFLLCITLSVSHSFTVFADEETNINTGILINDEMTDIETVPASLETLDEETDTEEEISTSHESKDLEQAFFVSCDEIKNEEIETPIITNDANNEQELYGSHLPLDYVLYDRERHEDVPACGAIEPYPGATYKLDYELTYTQWFCSDHPEIDENTITGDIVATIVDIKLDYNTGLVEGSVSGDLVFPEQINGYDVVYIGGSYEDYDSNYQPITFENIIVPDTVRVIETTFRHDGYDEESFQYDSSITLGKNIEVFIGHIYGSYKGDVVIPDSVRLAGVDFVGDCTGALVLGKNMTPRYENKQYFSVSDFKKIVNNSDYPVHLQKSGLFDIHSYYDPKKKKSYTAGKFYYYINEKSGEPLEHSDEELKWAVYYLPKKETAVAKQGYYDSRYGYSYNEIIPEENVTSLTFWGFPNTEDNYGTPANGYCIAQADYNRLISNLPKTAKADMKKNYNINGSEPVGSEWDGSCYGMSTSTLRINDANDAVSDYALGTNITKLGDVKAADDQFKNGGQDSVGQAESVINFYHYQQTLPEYQNVRATFGAYSRQKQIEEVAKLAKTAQNNKRPAVIDLWWKENGEILGHSINAIGYRELTSGEGLYATYPHCILTYDCSNPDKTGNNSACNVYFDDDGNWTVPGWGITPANAEMICGSNDPSVVGPVDYKTGSYAGTATMPASISYDGDDGAWEFQWSDNEVEVDGAELTKNITDDDTVTLLPEATDQNGHDYRIYIPEDKDYTITGDIIDHTIRINDQMIKINAEEGGRAVIKQNGEVTVEADDNGQIVIEIISDNDNGKAPSHVILTAEDADELVGQITDDGVIVKGSGLSNLEIQSDNIKVTVHSEETEVLVVQNDDGTIDIFEDKDHNGTFDDPVEAEAVGFAHSKIPAQTYTGAKLTPDVKVYFEGKLLKKGTDYTVKYTNNTNVTTKATVTITGKGNFTGSDTETFEIKPKNIEDSDVRISDIAPASYNKKKNYTPVPTVTYKGKRLKNKTDFNVAYFSDEICKTSVTPQNGGKYYAKVTGIKNFTGSKVIPFEIAATGQIPVSKLTIEKIPDQKYTGEQRTPAPVVKNGKNPLAENTHYTLSWGTNTEIGTGTVTITGIAPYVGTRTVAFNITGIPMNKTNIEIVPAICVYSGEAQTPLITSLYYKAEKKYIAHATQAEYNAMTEEEKKAVDCIVSYKNNTNAGTATITLKGIHGATGTINKTFKIQPFPVENRPGDPPGCPFKVELASETYPYAKDGTKPVPIVTFDGMELKNNKDYKVTYLNNSAVTTDRTKKLPTVKVTGIGNFTGTDTTATFKITKADMTETGIKVIANDVVYKNKKGNWKTKVTVIGPDGKALKAGTDYSNTVQFTLEDGVTKIGDKETLGADTIVKIKIDGKGSYTGSATGEYRITKQNIGALTASVNPLVYTGKAQTISADDIVWKLKKQKVNGVTFTIDESSYKNNVNVSTKKNTATVTVYGTGNYGGKTTVTFKINAKRLSWWWKIFDN